MVKKGDGITTSIKKGNHTLSIKPRNLDLGQEVNQKVQEAIDPTNMTTKEINIKMILLKAPLEKAVPITGKSVLLSQNPNRSQ